MNQDMSQAYTPDAGEALVTRHQQPIERRMLDNRTGKHGGRYLYKGHATQESVLDLARARMAHIYRQFDHVVVSFSGGKDSTVCLNLALEEARRLGRLPLHVFFFDEEATPYETEEYVRRVSQLPDVRLDWYCVPLRHRNACSRAHPFWSPWDPAERAKWVRPMPPEAITELAGYGCPPMEQRLYLPQLVGLLFPPAQYGNVGMVMGLRAQESINRRRAVSRRLAAEDNYIIHDQKSERGTRNLWKCYPIYDWRTEDVWTAPALLGWDYNRAYDLMDKAGVAPHNQRCSPAFGEEPLRGFWTYRVCFPAIWDQMSTRVPGANTAMRYATTEVYGTNALPEKPEDMTWQAFLLHYIARFGAEAPRVQKRVLGEFRRHYDKTAEPILPETPHPLTGSSWRNILRLAMRGDFKDRNDMAVHVGMKDRAKVRQQYLAEWRRCVALHPEQYPPLDVAEEEGAVALWP